MRTTINDKGIHEDLVYYSPALARDATIFFMSTSKYCILNFQANAGPISLFNYVENKRKRNYFCLIL